MSLRVYVDTDVLIAAYETGAPMSDRGWAVLQAFEGGEFEPVTSELTSAELLPAPLAADQRDPVAAYSALLGTPSPMRVVPIGRSILLEAANLRAQGRRFELPDAIHVASALAQGCTAILTDDLRLPLPDGLQRVRPTISTLSASRQHLS